MCTTFPQRRGKFTFYEVVKYEEKRDIKDDALVKN